MRRAGIAALAVAAALAVCTPPALTGSRPPDLFVEEGATVTARGAALDVVVTVGNGGERESGETTVAVEVPPTWPGVEPRPLAPVAPGEPRDVTFTFAPPPADRGQTRTLVFTVDPVDPSDDSGAGAVSESNEENNTTRIPIQVPPRAPTAVSAVSGGGTYGGSARLTATLTSDGAGLAGKTVMFRLGGATVEMQTGDGGVATVAGVRLGGFEGGTHSGAVGAAFGGDDDYAGSRGTGDLLVGRAEQAPVTVTGPESGVYGRRVDLAASGGSGTGALTLRLEDSDACELVEGEGGRLEITRGTGTCRVRAERAGDRNYVVAVSAPHDVTPRRAEQAPLTVTGPDRGDEGDRLELSASGGSGTGAVTFRAVGDSDACELLDGGTLAIRGDAGTCRVRAPKAGDANYEAAASPVHEVAIGAAAAPLLPEWLLPGLLALAALAAAAALGARRLRRPGPAEASAWPAPVPERSVRVGFAPAGAPERPLAADEPLRPGRPYLFWLDVGPPVVEPAAGEDAGDVRLTLALFSLDGFQLEPGADVGELRLGHDGGTRVVRQPAAGVPSANGRIFLPARAPAREGAARLRCSLYHRDALVQSRLVTAVVRREGRPAASALRVEVDYTLAPALDPAHLERLPQHRLSMLLNRNDEGTHGITFRGEGELTTSATVGEGAVTNLVREARGALRLASWGDEDPWEDQKRYLYEDVDEDRLRRDLVHFARVGYRFYTAIVNTLHGGDDETERLAALMRRPGLVQVAARESVTQLLPAALLYDHESFRTTGRPEAYDLCPAFLRALDAEPPLEHTPCFRGECPSRGEHYTVCPSGFWGYRHDLGVPPSIRGAPDAATEIAYDPGPTLVVAVSTDESLVMRAVHERVLRALLDGNGAWRYADTQAETLRLLKEGKPHVVYFYCHGGFEHGVPYLQVGPLDEEPITSDLLHSAEIRWDVPRPLVFVNGCRTTALEPEQALEFVTVLLRRASAAGVIGTEITIFEPLARAFAEECLRHFLTGRPLGEAVRAARLALLKDGNPLGLAYVPFALPSLRMVAASASSAGPAARPSSTAGRRSRRAARRAQGRRQPL